MASQRPTSLLLPLCMLPLGMALLAGCANPWSRAAGGNAPQNVSADDAARLAAPPALAEPAADLTREQAQWWSANRQLARWVPGHGFQIAGVDGYFDAAGHLSASGVARASFEQPFPAAMPGGSDERAPGEGSLWSRMTGQNLTDIGDENAGDTGTNWLWYHKKKKADEPKARARFAEAEEAFRAKQYDVAADAYAAAGEEWVGSPLEEDALFMRGESLFFADRYSKAFDAYETLLNKYQRSRHLENAVAREFRIGTYWFEYHDKHPEWLLTPNLTDKTRPHSDTLGWALKAMEKVRLNDPTGPLADASIMATGNSYFNRGYFEDADASYTLLRHEYPKSQYQYNAHLAGIEAKRRSYQGPAYDGKPLKATEELINQTLAQFPQAPPEHRQALLHLKEQIIAARAERDWQMAQYYEKQEYYGAAKVYYENLIKNYPNTQIARVAGDRIAQIADKPAMPEPHLAWIEALVPEPPDPKRLAVRSDIVPADTVQR